MGSGTENVARGYDPHYSDADLLEDIRIAEEQIAAGQGIPHDEAWRLIQKHLRSIFPDTPK
jgi:hypothetical protein